MPARLVGDERIKAGIKVGHASHVTRLATSHFSTKLAIKGPTFLCTHTLPRPGNVSQGHALPAGPTQGSYSYTCQLMEQTGAPVLASERWGAGKLHIIKGQQQIENVLFQTHVTCLESKDVVCMVSILSKTTSICVFFLKIHTDMYLGVCLLILCAKCEGIFFLKISLKIHINTGSLRRAVASRPWLFLFGKISLFTPIIHG